MVARTAKEREETRMSEKRTRRNKNEREENKNEQEREKRRNKNENVDTPAGTKLVHGRGGGEVWIPQPEQSWSTVDDPSDPYTNKLVHGRKLE